MNRDFETLRASLGDNVRCARLEHDLSQEQLAFEAEIDRTYVSQIERGVINPSLHVLWKIANALSVDVVDLLRSEQQLPTA